MEAEDKTAARDYGSDEAPHVVVPLAARRDSGMTDEDGDELDGMSDADRLPWPPRARRISKVAKFLSIAIPLCWLIGWPLGSMMANQQVTGVWAFKPGITMGVILWAVTTGLIIRFVGYVLALALRLEASAERLEGRQAPTMHMPEQTEQHVAALNDEIDRALGKLAEAESMIRQQVRAIGTATEALGTGSTETAQRLEKERNALMALTEEMNREADRFADKIAERTQAAADEQTSWENRLLDREQEFDEQLNRLEEVSGRSFDRFEELARAMEQSSEALKATHGEAAEQHQSLTDRLEENTARVAAAQAELANQTSKLEELLADQRRRAERLARAVTEQAHRVTTTPAEPKEDKPKPAPAPKGAHAWKDILAKVEEANPAPLERPSKQTPDAFAAVSETPAIPAAEPEEPQKDEKGPEDMDALDRLVVRIQNYSLVLQTQLFGGPGHEELDRFEAGERQIFAKALMGRDPDTLRARIKAELDQNAVFRERTAEFLRDFDTILEPLSAEAGGADTIQTYLTSPLGRLYMLTGSAAGHFD